eukprot:TRINITY_DN934_c0_g1_i1.p1 TRINITY_DN934_c0_g1~~TRINITY_DN934_c0_g1_i1.p1  ORF type:complete len:194 (-),score=30.42 TRINITY_DN934_c0_g1_i1:190-771(-)
MTMMTGKNIPTPLDEQCFAALHHVLRPEYHGLIPDWIKKASETEKRGILQLKQIAEPKLTQVVGRPKPDAHSLTMSQSSWHHSKQLQLGPEHPSGWPPRELEMRRSYSSPMFGGLQQSEEFYPSWMQDDAKEMAQISKPGGYFLNLKDPTAIQTRKNAERNKGTFVLFGGGFDGRTTQKATHNRRSIGLDERF